MAVCSEAISYISLCSGVGGLDIGLRRALPAALCVCYVEREITAASVLAARAQDGSLDDAPIWSDLRTFDAGAWRGVGGIIGGIPCQPFSVAGKRQGEHDDRNLWDDALRIVRESGAEWCFFENVPGMANKSVDWYYYRSVRPRLQEMGFRAAEGFFTAAEVGAPHRRERLFILAQRDGFNGDRRGNSGQRGRAELTDGNSELADAGYDGTERDSVQARDELQPGGWDRATLDQPGAGSDSLGDANGPGLEGREQPVSERGYELPAWPPGPADSDAWARILTVRPDLAPAVRDVADAAHRKGRQVGVSPLSDAYRIAPEPGIRNLADGPAGGALGLGRVAKLRLLGNAVVPAQAELAFRTLKAALR